MRYVVLLLVVLVVLGTGGFVWFAWHGSIAPIAPPARASFDLAAIARGARLAGLGDCISCHTVPGGTPFAGGRAIQTPFGTIYASNITPDPETGIGAWSEAAFRRAMRQGVDRGGHHLYPAFPYDHFTRVTDADDADLYAYLMTREPARASIPSNDLPFPLDIRALLAGWKLLFLHPAPFHPDSAQSEAWNRGAYLVQGLAHCGACHTPRNFLGAEKAGRHFDGGEVQGWYADPLGSASLAPEPWTEDSLYAYLRHGWQARHGVALGPMGEVTHDLAGVPDDDLRAIATYVASQGGTPPARQGAAAPAITAPTASLAAASPAAASPAVAPQQAASPPAAASPSTASPAAASPQAASPPPAASATVPSSAASPSTASPAALSPQAASPPPAASATVPPSAASPLAASASPPAPPGGAGEALYRGACASCHDASRGPPFGGIDLALSSVLHAPNPTDLANVVVDGIPATGEERAPIMPGFGAVLTDRQMLDLLTWLRARFGGPPPWDGIPDAIHAARNATALREAAR